MYQFKLVFCLEKKFLPRELDRLLVSFLKASVQNYSEEFYEKLYNKSESIMKKYVFSYFLPNARFSNKVIWLGQNSFTMYFSDMDMGEMICFLNAFKGMQFKPYPIYNNTMQLMSITTQKCKEIVDSEIIIKMQSSLLVRRHNSTSNRDIYYTYEHEEFNNVLKENIKFFVDKLKISVSIDDFSIMPVKAKKVVVPVFGRNLDANLGIYKLTGNTELLNILYLSGMGARRSSGHGKFEIVL